MASPPLIPEQRRQEILRLLRQSQVLSFNQLTEQLGVSHMTVRRDVEALAKQGAVESTPGGARLASRLLREPDRDEKAVADRPEKEAMAVAAAAMVTDGMTVYLDAGTTVQAMRPHLGHLRELTVVSNDLATVADFLDHPGVDLICLGGRVERENRSTAGRLATLALKELSLDVAFLSSSSWDVGHGVTTPVEAKVDVKRAALAAAGSTVLVAGSSKYGRFARYRVLRLDEVDTVITDDGLGDAAAGEIEGSGAELVRVPAAAR
ncbi:Transcriptional repressor of the fructose operon, DeoR family [Pseudonocardia sp. Ae168_Ps1]|uniref:DeoR/GlpR family DNA-binding transcription regulator n=1 Tax=unclassified Pseudonocardia TaxID=2619320 RepID=UPI0001FFF156|nr:MULTISPECIES: DeoR/GlpR family DNA-binding transcription regulator [unclassified Pseudonocardia]ALE73355.1 cytochrome C [Pseudonocardia sp. EC080625-04]ALL76693.1 cytochrome C [Pseudonocardia sp. EC080610-09]ALL83721.1 cytochrome C [Pseudonocardia sp. EC080619-01]OLL72344.1 Transcriptional repressor of the fructose operon, DeoR family [Pseudonocardia sp. Ae150A_Ps1]OLL78316.1 Transcriptional repressor of the fructose operon, DeoR family [Pseudonocardia sp. Ae168_Ps1]